MTQQNDYYMGNLANNFVVTDLHCSHFSRSLMISLKRCSWKSTFDRSSSSVLTSSTSFWQPQHKNFEPLPSYFCHSGMLKYHSLCWGLSCVPRYDFWAWADSISDKLWFWWSCVSDRLDTEGVQKSGKIQLKIDWKWCHQMRWIR